MIRCKLVIVLAAMMLWQESAAEDLPKGPITKEQLADTFGMIAVKAMCSHDPMRRECMGYSYDDCSSTIVDVTILCQDRIVKSMPDMISKREEINRYSESFVRCEMSQMILRKRKDFDEVDKCIAEHESVTNATEGVGASAPQSDVKR